MVFKLLILLLFVSCNSELKVTEAQIRSQFSEQLKPLPQIHYMSLFGRKPGKTELELGRLLFNDPILARNNDVSCATCHLANHGFADGIGLSVGALGIGGPTRKNVGDEFATGFIASNREVGDDGFGFR